MRVFIVDDSEDSIEKLTFLLHKYLPELSIVGIANSGKEAITAINETQPELLFLDIEMNDMTGFEMIERLERGINIKVIFTTAHEKYAIKAIRTHAVGYLLKPISKDDLLATIRGLNGIDSSTHENQVQIKSKGKIEKIAFTTSDGLVFKNVADIIHCESDRNYTMVYFINHEKLLVAKTLKDIDETLEGNGFCRVHNSHLVNLNHISKYHRGDGGYVVMTNGDNINVARNRKEIFLESFSKF
ncbi:MAG: LytR/AlgR family response regulator transcription factor [Saprospiraceae bacterium]|jgi:two-component system LytT family response regulator